jgi:hypothetical protein
MTLMSATGALTRHGAWRSRAGKSYCFLRRRRAAVNDYEQEFHLNRRSLPSFPRQMPNWLASMSNGETEMTKFKVLSAGLIAAAIMASPVMAREYKHVAKGSDVSATRDVLDCVRAPDVGAFASDPYTRPPCEPASFN